MLKYLPASDNVIACSIAGHLGADDLHDITEKVLAAVERTEPTHMFCEIAGLTSIDWKASHGNG